MFCGSSFDETIVLINFSFMVSVLSPKDVKTFWCFCYHVPRKFMLSLVSCGICFTFFLDIGMDVDIFFQFQALVIRFIINRVYFNPVLYQKFFCVINVLLLTI